MTTATAAFRSLLQTAANGVPVPLTSVRFQSLQRQCVGLHLFASLPGRPVLLPPSAAAGEAFSSDGEYYSEEDEEYLEEEEDEVEEVEAPPAYSSPQSRPPRGQEPGRLFVGNLPYTMTSAELSEAFSSDGEYYSEEDEEYLEEEEDEVEEVEAPPAYSSPQSRPPRGQDPGRLFVGNLLYTMTSAELSEAGRVDDAQIIYDKVTNRSRGFAFVTMATAEEAAKAVQMFDGALLGGRTVRVNYPEVPRGGERRTVTMGGRSRDDGTYKIYAGNLGWGVRADELRAAFEGQPGLLDARVIFERETGRSRGFGFVSFTTAKDAQSAMKTLDGVELEGRPLRLSLAEQNPPAGSPLSTLQAQQEETASDTTDAEAEATSASDLDESTLQTTAAF